MFRSRIPSALLSVEFFLMLTASFQCSGRGLEVALVMSKGINDAEVNEGVHNYHTLSVDMQ